MYEERPPAPGLAARVACHWHNVSETDSTQLVVPDACVDLIWGPGGLFVAGPDTGPMPKEMAAGDVFVGVRFRPGAASDLFGVPLHTLRDQRVPLSDLPAATDPAFPATSTAPDLAAKHTALTTMTRAWLTRLTTPAGPRDPSCPADPAAPFIARALRVGRPVSAVARDLGLSERQLHRRSLTAFGYAPKTLQRVVRFQRALRLARAGVPLATVAAEAGYADQAHLSPRGQTAERRPPAHFGPAPAVAAVTRPAAPCLTRAPPPTWHSDRCRSATPAPADSTEWPESRPAARARTSTTTTT
ncbi:Helix-turn-helix domain protein [Nonomuraea coxensis DSM 45129]|uniref:Helix-turn-helix domain protein n=1 Tax=Nonomuraea coxensis DSM 45129 TaxID=1122611 RepID=A0ABX8TY46_9ACTN|nr:Helix-turn-helix domain protein [Nonomuraea coxensis DSM 45129]